MQSFPLKFVLIGDSRVGKSQLSRSYAKKPFNPDAQSTVGMEFATKTVEFERCVIKAHLWDTAGQDRFDGMTRVYFRDAVGAALIYDVTCKESFENLKARWQKQIKEFGTEPLRLLLIGNKIDLVQDAPDTRQVSVDEAMDFAEEEKMDFIETSALTGQHVEEAFRRLILSVAKTVPNIQANLEMAALPDGWMIHAPMEDAMSSPPQAARRPSVRKVDITRSVSAHMESNSSHDPFSMEIEDGGEPRSRRKSLRMASSLSSPGLVTMNDLHSRRVPSIASTDAGGTTAETFGSDPGLAQSYPPHNALGHDSPGSVYSRPRLMFMNYWTGALTEDQPSRPAETSLLFVAGSVRKKLGSKSGTDERALTERSSSVRTFKTNEDNGDKGNASDDDSNSNANGGGSAQNQKKQARRRCFCCIL